MLTLLLAAAVASASPSDITVLHPPAPVEQAVDPAKDQPLVCAKQFMLNIDRHKLGEKSGIELIIEYAVKAKMTPAQAMDFIRGCDMFNMGASFGILLIAPQPDAGADEDLGGPTAKSTWVSP
jgi:hypothetical protein